MLKNTLTLTLKYTHIQRSSINKETLQQVRKYLQLNTQTHTLKHQHLHSYTGKQNTNST